MSDRPVYEARLEDFARKHATFRLGSKFLTESDIIERLAALIASPPSVLASLSNEDLRFVLAPDDDDNGVYCGE